MTINQLLKLFKCFKGQNPDFSRRLKCFYDKLGHFQVFQTRLISSAHRCICGDKIKFLEQIWDIYSSVFGNLNQLFFVRTRTSPVVSVTTVSGVFFLLSCLRRPHPDIRQHPTAEPGFRSRRSRVYTATQ